VSETRGHFVYRGVDVTISRASPSLYYATLRGSGRPLGHFEKDIEARSFQEAGGAAVDYIDGAPELSGGSRALEFPRPCLPPGTRRG